MLQLTCHDLVFVLAESLVAPHPQKNVIQHCSRAVFHLQHNIITVRDYTGLKHEEGKLRRQGDNGNHRFTCKMAAEMMYMRHLCAQESTSTSNTLHADAVQYCNAFMYYSESYS